MGSLGRVKKFQNSVTLHLPAFFPSPTFTVLPRENCPESPDEFLYRLSPSELAQMLMAYPKCKTKGPEEQA